MTILKPSLIHTSLLSFLLLLLISVFPYLTSVFVNSYNMQGSTMPGKEKGMRPPEGQEANASPTDLEKDIDPLHRKKTYTFSGSRGWKSYRILRPGRGMYHDVKRRLPYYWSDITDALTYRTCASTLRMYFVK
jgi:HCO3- transporter family